MSQEQRKGLPILGILGGLAGAAYLGFVRPQLLKWGTRLGEPQRRLPGDELIPAPNFQTTVTKVHTAVFRTNNQTVTQNTTIATAENALAIGPLTIDPSATITVDGNLTIL